MREKRTQLVHDQNQLSIHAPEAHRLLLTLKNLRIEACFAPLLHLCLPLRLALGCVLALALQARSLRDSHGSTLNVIFLHLLQNGHGFVAFERAIGHVFALRVEQIYSQFFESSERVINVMSSTFIFWNTSLFLFSHEL